MSDSIEANSSRVIWHSRLPILWYLNIVGLLISLWINFDRCCFLPVAIYTLFVIWFHIKGDKPIVYENPASLIVSYVRLNSRWSVSCSS